MRLLVLAFAFTVVAIGADDSSLLGELTWCDTLCLCHRWTREQTYCFTNRELYSLVQINERTINRMESVQYNPVEKLTWCSDTCLCHRTTQMHFKCIESPSAIVKMVPQLAPYFGTGLNSTELPYDTTDDAVDEITEESRTRKGKKKNRKNRKNKKKWHKNYQSTTAVPMFASTESPADYVSINRAMVLGPPLLQEPHYAEMIDHTRSSAPPEAHVIDREVVTEISKELESLRQKVQHLKEKALYNDRYMEELRQAITFNTFVNYVFSAATAGLFLCFLILCIVMCCRKNPTKKSDKAHPESINKGNISEAW